MSIRPDIEQWRVRFGICLLAAMSLLIFTGAKAVHQEFRVRPAVRHEVSRQWRDMVAVLSAETRSRQAPQVAEMTDWGAMLVIKACSQTSTRH